jgi:hypothetical protein
VLQIGTESPRDPYVTDALAAVFSEIRIQELASRNVRSQTEIRAGSEARAAQSCI